ncbi:hypothetical protein KFE25_005861 [Diacronema lutheri]|uniref:Uncharacterized protein n=1 Tax=Diacronema lutheri TaxID=2081491 RepID=A0A8J5XI40_DIALT|nr:hypothetical protein KFE25_005861 [Diacronema lutheri]
MLSSLVRSGAHARRSAWALSRAASSASKKSAAQRFKPEPLVNSAVEADVNLTERQIWEQPHKLLPERQDLIWDDGVAKPEWYIDRDCWSVSNGQAATRLFGMIFFGLGGMIVFWRAFYDKLGYKSVVVPRELPFNNASAAYGGPAEDDE